MEDILIDLTKNILTYDSNNALEALNGKKLRVATMSSRQVSMPKQTEHKHSIEESQPPMSKMEYILIDLAGKAVTHNINDALEILADQKLRVVYCTPLIDDDTVPSQRAYPSRPSTRRA